jgi:hypothetical protein
MFTVSWVILAWNITYTNIVYLKCYIFNSFITMECQITFSLKLFSDLSCGINLRQQVILGIV